MSDSNELTAASATLEAKVAESRALDTSVINKDNENIELVSVEQWIENVDELSKLGVGVIVKPSDDVKLLQDTLNNVTLIALDFNNFDDERSLLEPLYNSYNPAITLIEAIATDEHLTHSTTSNNPWDRKLDYLFTNLAVVENSGQTHQNTTMLSDHAPVTAIVTLP